MIKEDYSLIDIRYIGSDSPFIEIKGKKGSKRNLEGVSNNYIVFVISGSLRMYGKNGICADMKSNRMYAVAKLCSPYYIEVLEDSHCLVLLVDSLVNHVNAKSILRLKSQRRKDCEGLPELKYNIVFQSFISSITLLGDCMDDFTDNLL